MKPSRPILACILGFALATVALAARQPNIVIILSDDMGYSDLGCYGGEIRTPNLDGLAADGIRFTQFYNTARCCPTRASLLTGLHPHQAGVGHMMEDRGHDGYRGRLNRRCVTLAEVLKPAGYATYAVGKWHVTPGQSAAELADTSNWPLQRGFERFYGTIHGAGSYFDPSSLVRDNRFVTVVNDSEYQPDQYYYTDAIADHAVRFIREHAHDRKDRPFLLYTAFTAAHWPLHARESDILRYRGRYDGGYEPVRAARLARQRELGLLDARWAPPVPAEDWAAVRDKSFESRCMEVYAAQVDCLDQGIGRIVSMLRETGQLENALIFYLQDNGACAEGMGRGAGGVPRADKPSLPPMGGDVAQQGSVPKQTRDGWPVRQGLGVMPGGPDTYIAYGRGWANVGNTPFREYKHWTHEGGISTPLIVHWPAGIGVGQRGRLERTPGQLMDIMATCVEVAGAAYPTERNRERIHPMEGTSLAPLFAGKPFHRKQPLAWEHEGNRAIREGRWKLVGKENQAWELYDLEADRTESRNLAASEPGQVARLAAMWDAWASRASVLPLGAWRGAPASGISATNTARRFDLKAGDRLGRAQSPAIAGRGFTITARIDAGGARNGVIVAQGGSAIGYALYLENGHVRFAVRSGGKPSVVASPSVLPPGPQRIRASLGPGGHLRLEVAGQAETMGDGGGIRSMPQDGLEVGRDDGGLVGTYGRENAFTGKIESVTIELDPP